MNISEFMDDWSMTESWPIKVIRRGLDGIEIIEGDSWDSRVLIHKDSIPKLIAALKALEDTSD